MHKAEDGTDAQRELRAQGVGMAAGVATSELELDGSFSCLSVLLQAVQSTELASWQPQVLP